MDMFTRALCAVGAVFGIATIAVACGSDGSYYDDSGEFVCSEDYDCYHGAVYLPGTRCVNNRCVCPVAGDVLCCKKGHTPDNCDMNCRSVSECEPGEMGVPEQTEPDAGPDAEPKPECVVAADCPGPLDKRCGSATCEEGTCGMVITPGPIASQLAGDCKRSTCNFLGVVTQEDDPSDVYDDGLECTFDVCSKGAPESFTILKIVCPVTREGYCSAGACVECTEDADCKASNICRSQRCVPATCDNTMLDPATETDEDCGGSCAPCVTGLACNTGADCRSEVCVDSKCQKPECVDGKKNGGETDVDCGAGCPGKLCEDGKGCKEPADCASRVCWGGKCQVMSCTDGVKNGDEVGIDCGGPCPTGC